MLRQTLTHLLTTLTILSVVCLLVSATTAYISPKYLHILVFTGFLFPIFWVVNFVFIFIHLIRKNWKRFAMVLAAGLITINHLSNVYQVNIPWEEEKGKNDLVIKIMSFNTRMFDYYSWTGKKNINEEVMDFIRLHNPDIVCFQEFFTFHQEADYSEHHILSRLNQYPYRHIEYNVISRKGKKFGQATFSKFPIVQKQSIHYPQTSNFTIQSDIRIKNKTIRVFNNHLESIRLNYRNYNFIDSINSVSDEERNKGLREISEKIRRALTQRATQSETLARHVKNSTYPVVVCGDFNDAPVSYVYRTMRGSLKDAFQEAGNGLGGTYNGRLPSFRIDFIFHDPSFTTYDFQTFPKNWSDHYPIMATIRL